MSRRVLKAALVDQEIAKLAVYIADRDLDAGLRFLDAVEKSFEFLLEFPEIGYVMSDSCRSEGSRIT